MNVNKISVESKTYIMFILFSILALFLLTSVIFMCLTADKLDIVMSQSAKITYTYFISIMDRLLVAFIFLIIIPLTIYQINTFNKTKVDKIVSTFAILVLLSSIWTFLAGEYNFFKAYKNGDLSESKMFNPERIEFKIFDKILNKS